MVDSKAVKNHKPTMGAKGGNQCIGKTAGGPTTKLSVIVDASGNSLGSAVTAGNVRDSQVSRSLIQILEEKCLSKAGKHDVESAVNVISWATKDRPDQSLSGLRRLRGNDRRASRKNQEDRSLKASLARREEECELASGAERPKPERRGNAGRRDGAPTATLSAQFGV